MKCQIGQHCHCGFKVRGENHDQGEHHKKGKPKPVSKASGKAK